MNALAARLAVSLRLVLAVLFGLSLAAGARAQAVYSYTGSNFTSVSAPWTTSDSITGSFTLPSALAPATTTDVSALLIDFSFSDGVNTRTLANSTVCQFSITTDPVGGVAAWSIFLRETPFTPGLPQQTVDSFSGSRDQAGVGPAAATACGSISPLTGFGLTTLSGSWLAPVGPSTIPSLSPTGLVILVVLLALAALSASRRRRSAAPPKGS